MYVSEPPTGTKIGLKRTDSRLSIEIPNRDADPAAWRQVVTIIGLAAAAVWVVDVDPSHEFGHIAAYICGATAAWMLGKVLYGIIGETRLSFSAQSVVIVKKLFGLGVTMTSKTPDLSAAQVEPTPLLVGVPDDGHELVFDDGARLHRFGGRLSAREQRWIVTEINAFLADAKKAS